MVMVDRSNELLEILGVYDKEDIITNLLCYCINVDRSFANCFIEAVCGKSANAYTNIFARARVGTIGFGTPDLVIIATDDYHHDLFIIENKVKADEGIGQTERYSTIDCYKQIQQKIARDANWRNPPTFIFLTLVPDQHPQGNSFKVSTYRQLLERLRITTLDGDPLTNIFVRAIQYQYSKFYDAGTVSDDDLILNHLADQRNIEGGFIYFQQMITPADLPAGFLMDSASRQSNPGRRYYLTKIGKTTWDPEPMGKDTTSGLYRLFPDRNYDIHFEVQAYVLHTRPRISVYLHYETNPYMPESDALQQIEPSGYRSYITRRNRFIEHIKHSPISNFIIRVGRNQIGRCDINITDNTRLSDFRKRLNQIMTDVAIVIDQFKG